MFEVTKFICRNSLIISGMFESYAGREKLVYENQRVAATGVPFISTCKAQTHCAAIT